MPDMTLEPLAESHLQDVLRIERECFPAPWTETMFRQEVEETWLSRSFVAVQDGHVVGYIIAWFLRGEVHVLNVAVTAKYQRHGIGRRLMSHVIELGEKSDHHLVTLEVRASNDPAKLLYVTMGFAPVGVRRRYYRDNDEDAIVMVKRLGERKAT
ncbi:MAG TPA: ribosomal protein S18-alanine N-acetyltransferase [Candidatus Krumholzibacteria bacterium]|nr:ribosomal protein S18-alanine N-acetyltransferase [Candidatus Krumholzibacteria bacterium]